MPVRIAVYVPRRAQPWTVERSFSGDTMSPLNDKGHRNSCPSARHGESYNDPVNCKFNQN